jgi:hypothetical protein
MTGRVVWAMIALACMAVGIFCVLNDYVIAAGAFGAGAGLSIVEALRPER